MESLIFGGVPSPPRAKHCAFHTPPCRKPGYLVELSQLIAERMGFKFELLAPLSGGWGKYNGTKWSGLMGDVISGRVNASLPLFLSPERASFTNYTQSVVTDERVFFVNKVSETSTLDLQWWKILDGWAWLSIALILALLTVLRAANDIPQVHVSCRRFASHISWIDIWQSVLALLCAGIFSSGILSYLLKLPTLPFHSLDGSKDALKSGKYRLAMRFWNAELTKPFHSVVDKSDVVLNKNFTKLLYTISAPGSNYFSYDIGRSAVKELTGFTDVRMIHPTDLVSSEIFFVIYTSHSFPQHLLDQIRSIIESLRKLGHVSRLERNYLYTPHPIAEKIGWVPITLFSCRYMFLGWICGIMVALAVFIVETIPINFKLYLQPIVREMTRRQRERNFSRENSFNFIEESSPGKTKT